MVRIVASRQAGSGFRSRWELSPEPSAWSLHVFPMSGARLDVTPARRLTTAHQMQRPDLVALYMASKISSSVVFN